LLAIDIDGTLLNSRDQLSPRTRDAVIRAVRAGMKVVLATGRRYGRAVHLVEPLEVRLPLITASGALIKHPANHRTLFRAELTRALLCRALEVIGLCGYDALLNADTFEQGFEFYCPRTDVAQPELAEFLLINAGLECVDSRLMVDPPPGVFSLFSMGPRDEMLALERRLNETLPGQLDTHVLRSPLYQGFMCEVAPAGINKWFAVQHLAQAWGIRGAEICAVGDDVNDLPMLRGAALGIAMGNSIDAIKAAADRIAPTNDDDGLAEAIDWLLAP